MMEFQIIAKRLLTRGVVCVFGRSVRVYHVFVAKQLHHLVKELEFLSLPSGNDREKPPPVRYEL